MDDKMGYKGAFGSKSNEPLVSLKSASLTRTYGSASSTNASNGLATKKEQGNVAALAFGTSHDV